MSAIHKTEPTEGLLQCIGMFLIHRVLFPLPPIRTGETINLQTLMDMQTAITAILIIKSTTTEHWGEMIT
ncbi:hypothetical protein D3C87_1691830 [compost metagenome]